MVSRLFALFLYNFLIKIHSDCKSIGASTENINMNYLIYYLRKDSYGIYSICFIYYNPASSEFFLQTSDEKSVQGFLWILLMEQHFIDRSADGQVHMMLF